MKRVKRLIKETNNVILGAGALAAAVVAVAGAFKLFSTPAPPAILAGIEDVTLETNVGLSEFEARDQTADLGIPGDVVPAPRGYRLAAYIAVTGSTGPTNDSGETETTPSTPATSPSTTPEHTTPESTTPTPTIQAHKEKVTRKAKHRHEGASSGTLTSTHAYKRTKVTGSTAPEGTTTPENTTTASSAAEGSSGPSGAPFVKPPTPEVPFKSEGSAKTLDGTGASTSEVEGVLAEAATAPISGVSPSKEETAPGAETAAAIALPRHCGSSCGAGPTVDQILADNPSPAQAAKEVATVFRHSRARYYDHELHPLGADVEYTLKLTGFVHNDAIFEWTLWSQSENHPLPHSWWQRVIVKQVKPSRYEESVSGTFWAPLPPKPGNYVFHLAVYDEQGNRRGHGSTPVFH